MSKGPQPTSFRSRQTTPRLQPMPRPMSAHEHPFLLVSLKYPLLDVSRLEVLGNLRTFLANPDYRANKRRTQRPLLARSKVHCLTYLDAKPLKALLVQTRRTQRRSRSSFGFGGGTALLCPSFIADVCRLSRNPADRCVCCRTAPVAEFPSARADRRPCLERKSLSPPALRRTLPPKPPPQP
jgi:hypothetical protein